MKRLSIDPQIKSVHSEYRDQAMRNYELFRSQEVNLKPKFHLKNGGPLYSSTVNCVICIVQLNNKSDLFH